MITIKNNYTIDDIDYRILESDVIKYSITRTKREDIITNSKYYYRYDNGLDKYTFDNGILNIKDLLPEYNGEEYYNIDDTTAYKKKELRYAGRKAKIVRKFSAQMLLKSMLKRWRYYISNS